MESENISQVRQYRPAAELVTGSRRLEKDEGGMCGGDTRGVCSGVCAELRERVLFVLSAGEGVEQDSVSDV